jgi:glycosidase
MLKKWFMFIVGIAAIVMFCSFGWAEGKTATKQRPAGKHTVQLGPVYEVSIEYFPNHSLKELTAEMARLEKLGIKIIYMTPVFECAGGAQYLITDYYKINPRYGTAADLKELVATAHRHGISVLLDFVTSLTYQGSYIYTQHPEWILRDAKGEMQKYFPFPDWGWALDCTNPQLIDYYTKLARHYVEEFDTDGWRLDSPIYNYDPKKVSGEHGRLELFRSVRAAVTQVKPSAILIAEVPGPTFMWSDSSLTAPPLYDEVCEASYNYPLIGFLGGSAASGYMYVVAGPWIEPQGIGKWSETLMNKVAHNRATSKEFVEGVKSEPVLYNGLRANFLENHDTARVSLGFPEQHRTLFVLIATMPGLPVVHAGQELGDKTKPDAGGPVPQVVNWKGGDKELEAFYTQMLKLRAENEALQKGDLEDVWKQGDNTIAFLRSSGRNHVITMLNLGGKEARSTLSIPIEKLGFKPESQVQLRDELNNETFTRKGTDLQDLELVVKPYGYRVITIKPI